MIRIRIKKNFSARLKSRLKIKAIIRKKIKGSSERPRLVVYRSNKHMYAQIVDDVNKKILFSSSSLDQKTQGPGCETAAIIGEVVAKKAIQKGIKKVIFDRNGFLYHGRVKAVAQAARKAGLQF